MKPIKKIIIIAAVLGFCICTKEGTVMAAPSEVEINKKNFPDEALRKEVMRFDTDRDGKLQESERENVEELNIYKFLDSDDIEEESSFVLPDYEKSSFVFDFKGIGYLTSLKKLTVNLSGGTDSEGKHYDSALSNIKSLYKVKGLTSLTIYSAKIKKVDLTKLPNLKKVDLSLSGVNSFQISNKALSKFRMGDTGKVKTLDFSNCPKLKIVYLDRLKAPVVKFGKKNKRVEELHISTNSKKKIKSIDTTPLRKLKRFTMTNVNIADINLTKNGNLDDIYLDNCSMKKLDLTGNKKLTWLGCEGKKIKKIILAKKNKISTFKWVNAGLSKFDVKRLNPDTLTSVILYRNKIKTLDLRKYKKLDYVSVDRKVTVKLAPSLTSEEVIKYF